MWSRLLSTSVGSRFSRPLLPAGPGAPPRVGVTAPSLLPPCWGREWTGALSSGPVLPRDLVGSQLLGLLSWPLTSMTETFPENESQGWGAAFWCRRCPWLPLVWMAGLPLPAPILVRTRRAVESWFCPFPPGPRAHALSRASLCSCRVSGTPPPFSSVPSVALALHHHPSPWTCCCPRPADQETHR